MPTCPMCDADVEDVENMDGHDMTKHPEGEGTEKPSSEDSTQKPSA